MYDEDTEHRTGFETPQTVNSLVGTFDYRLSVGIKHESLVKTLYVVVTPCQDLGIPSVLKHLS